MPEKVTIPISIIDYSSDYVRPIMSIWMNRAELVQSMFDALLKWNLDVNDVEPITTGKPAEQGIKIRLRDKRVTFFFGPAGCKFTREGVDWSTASETIEILQTCIATLIAGSNAELHNHKLALILHLQPTKRNFLELLHPFLSLELQSMRSGKLQTGASIVKWEDGKITLDGSGIIANGIFVKYERDFDIATSLETIANEFRSGEDTIFRLLDVEAEE